MTVAPPPRPGSQQARVAVCLFGPTATGKSDVAIALRERLPVDIISADSAMVYRGMDIGTAKPPPAVRQRHPHALVNIVEPDAAFSAAAFRDAAVQLLRQSWRAGRVPLVVGGSMFWFRALLAGLNDLPGADAGVRAAIDAAAARDGWPRLHAQLAAVDPAAARRIHPNDPQRLQRALEIHALTGQPPSRLWQQPAGLPLVDLLDATVLQVALVPADRARLHRRIETRLQLMLDHGLVDEVLALRGRGNLHLELPSMRAVGYRQVWRWLDAGGRRAGYPAMAEQAVAATRQLAKRQLTWLRRWDVPGCVPPRVFEPLAGDPAARVYAHVRRALVAAGALR